MGLCLSSQINMLLIQYLKSLKGSGQDSYTVAKYEKEFFLNGSPGSPKCNMFVRNSSIEAPDELCFDESDALGDQPITMKTPKVKIDIGEAIVRCDDLGYVFRVSGKIQIFDVHVNAAITPSFEDGLKIDDVNSTVTVKKIKSEIQLTVNGSDHSRLANSLLSTDNPDLANTILNSLLVLQKGLLKDLLNTHLSSMSTY